HKSFHLFYYLVIFALILMPMISAFMPYKTYVQPCMPGCIGGAECNTKCRSMGHPKGGDCLGDRLGGEPGFDCCCIAG
ncbi:hypothetical protein CARUB_v10007042mg, partial [Capsella rubella]